MLVKKDIVETWYQPDHFIFRSFDYIWCNPVWDISHKKQGACPYIFFDNKK